MHRAAGTLRENHPIINGTKGRAIKVGNWIPTHSWKLIVFIQDEIDMAMDDPQTNSEEPDESTNLNFPLKNNPPAMNGLQSQVMFHDTKS